MRLVMPVRRAVGDKAKPPEAMRILRMHDGYHTKIARGKLRAIKRFRSPRHWLAMRERSESNGAPAENRTPVLRLRILRPNRWTTGAANIPGPFLPDSQKAVKRCDNGNGLHHKGHEGHKERLFSADAPLFAPVRSCPALPEMSFLLMLIDFTISLTIPEALSIIIVSIRSGLSYGRSSEHESAAKGSKCTGG